MKNMFFLTAILMLSAAATLSAMNHSTSSKSTPNAAKRNVTMPFRKKTTHTSKNTTTSVAAKGPVGKN